MKGAVSIYRMLRIMGILFLIMGIGIFTGVYGGDETLYSNLIVGSAFLLVGMVLMFIVLRHDRKKKRLKAEGVRVLAEVIDIYKNPFRDMGGPHIPKPYIVRVDYIHPISGKSIAVNSEILMEHPLVHIGDKVEILIDPADERSYYVPTENL